MSLVGVAKLALPSIVNWLFPDDIEHGLRHEQVLPARPFEAIISLNLTWKDEVTYFWKEHHTPRGSLLWLLRFTYLQVVNYLAIVIIVGIVTFLVGPDAKQKLKILARSLAETNLSCDLITTGNADVAGPGVRLLKFLADTKIWGSVAVQVIVTSAAIFLANSHELIVWHSVY
jgi:hypothetical protein